ncbi:all trans-polyprenyl-diphosphate synthase PDSS2 [Neocloeon triangulifer]|uniref:all trans-polyprenyl-diphosphate synthase PDSS2 n=1 Tax=Neocloeon triangulifer TaxID=2078957 RepID=UPI00286FA5FD|nr:all trans-polyprenyl-diphosphate synthase PDSS2 [Neocloeon triangulifer]XP_059475903.1 all trans-polyprenyl-diphosphate synthase PDSS2 [Neocloeon triangulifer]XP_059475904.1 all trans-polyprenyl-diphosphate synthase PDSS2 [Neocloeon triangulifer]
MSLATKPIYCVSRAGRFLFSKTSLVYRNAPTVSVLVQGHNLFSTSSVQLNKQAINPRPDWNRAVSEAEKIVGYPTSFLSLRWLLSDEIANIALHLRKLVGSNHPLLKTAKGLLNNGRSSMQAWGLIVLLVSKVAGHKLVDDIEIDKAAGVLHSQRALAEVTEMIRTSNLVHKGLVNIYPGMYPDDRTMQDMTFGNKIALLSGDYLLGNSCAELATLRNCELVELMSSAVRDMAEAEFVGERDKQNQPLPSPGLTEQDWTLRSVLSAGSLLGKSCQGTLKLAGHGEELQLMGYRFGQHLALAWQACLELEPFTSSAGADGQMSFTLTSAPVIFTLQHDPSLFEEIDKGRENIDDVDYSKIHAAVMKGPGIAQTKELQRHHAQKALQELEGFEENDARKALSNIIFAMGEI